MEKKIRRLLFGFFAVMLVFTYLSRAAASVMVPKVQTDIVKGGSLTYIVNGTGIIKADAHQYIDLISGYRIGAVAVEEGQQVNEGDLLFTYETDPMKEKEKTIQTELEKLQLQYQAVGIEDSSVDSAADDKSVELTIENAKQDIEKAKADIKDRMKSVKESKEKEYTEAVAKLKDVIASKNEAINAAVRAVGDAEDACTALTKTEATANELINYYKAAVKSGDEALITIETNELYNFIYNKKYEEHQQEVTKAKNKLDWAKQDLTDIQNKWSNITLDEIDQYRETEIKNAYYQQLEQKKEEINNAFRAVTEAQDALNALTIKDEKIAAAISAYRADITNGVVDVSKSYASLYAVLTDDKLASKEELNAADKKLSRAKEDEETIRSNWEEKQKTAEEEVEKREQDLAAIEDGSYDYTEDLKEVNEELSQAQRTYNNALLQQEKAADTKQSAAESKKNKEEANDIARSLIEVDIRDKEEELKKLREMISEGGEVHAPAAGVITDNDLEQGVTLSGQEKFILTTGGYELEMTADKDDLQYFSAGDEVEIATGAENEKVSSTIENIGLPDKNESVSFTALLPEGDYEAGANLSFSLTKDSEQYDKCIPIQALRQDNQGTYVLLVSETDSVLGEVEEAFRMNVTVLSRDTKSAAVDASLSEEDQIIVGSNRNLAEGDRVRIYETE